MGAGSILAFTDDDVVVDRHWLAAIAEAFLVADNVGAVTGLIQPAELCTPAQKLIEDHGAFGKGFTTRVFDLAAHRPPDHRFPLAIGQCGSGANMAFDAGCLRHLRGFNPSLGAGTRARGGDDLAAFFNVVTADYSLVYQPAAVVRHWHPDSDAAVARQAYSYGVGLGAYLTHACLHRPGIALRTALGVVRPWLRPTRPVAGPCRQRLAGLPPDLVRLGRRGPDLWPARLRGESMASSRCKDAGVTIAPIAALPLAPEPPREHAPQPGVLSCGGLGRGVSVVICSYTDARWELLVRASRSAALQVLRPAQIVVVIDHCPSLLRRAREQLVERAGLDDRRLFTIVPNTGQAGPLGCQEHRRPLGPPQHRRLPGRRR